MKSNKELRDAKMERVNRGRLMEELTENTAFNYLLNQIGLKAETAKESVLNASSWEDFLKRKYFLEGISYLRQEMEQIISAGRVGESKLKNK